MQYGVLDYTIAQKKISKSGIFENGVYFSVNSQNMKQSQLVLRTGRKGRLNQKLTIYNSGPLNKEIKILFYTPSDISVFVTDQKFKKTFSIAAKSSAHLMIQVQLKTRGKRKYQFYAAILDKKGRVLHEIPALLLKSDF